MEDILYSEGGEALGAPSLEAVKARLDGILAACVGSVPAHGWGCTWMDFEVPSNTSHPVIL